MRVVQADGLGGAEVLALRETAEPSCGPGQVLVRSVASTVNPVDRKMRANQNLSFPITLGWDVAGIVVESAVAEYQPGDRVIAMTNPMQSGIGAWADLVALDASHLAHAPLSVSLAEASGIPLAGLTAQQAWAKLELSPGDRVLVTGTAGAIGGFAVQFAAHDGVQVDGLVARPTHIDHVKELGAGFVTEDPSAVPKRAYAAIIDTVSLPTKGVDVREFVTVGGQYVATGKDSSGIPGAQSVMVSHDPDGLAHLAKLVDDGALRLRVVAHYGLEDVRVADEHAATRGLLGKVVLHF